MDDEADVDTVTENLVNEPSYAIEKIKERIEEDYDTDRWSDLLYSIYQAQNNNTDTILWNL